MQGQQKAHWQTNAANARVGSWEETQYYPARQYFQKKSVTQYLTTATTGVSSSLKRTTTFYVGDKTGYDEEWSGTTATGNKGSVMAVVSPTPDASSDNLVYEYTYWDTGQKKSEINPKGSVTTFSYGTLGSTGSYPAIDDGSGFGRGNLTEVIQDYGTNKLNRRTRMEYDEAGRVKKSVDPAAQTSTFGYNNLGQPTSAAFPATTNTAAQTIAYTYGGNGRMATVSETCPTNSTLDRGTTTLSYEAGNDRVSSVADPTSGTLSYTYGKLGERTTMTLPGGGVWRYRYNGDLTGASTSDYRTYPLLPKDDPNSFTPRLVSLQDEGDGSGAVRQVEVYTNAMGRLMGTRFNQSFSTAPSSTSWGSSPNSFTQTVYTYDDTFGWLTEQKTQHWTGNGYTQQYSPTLIADHVYTVNAYTGLRTENAQSVRLPNGNLDTFDEDYQYDNLNRLKDVVYGDTNQHQTYGFDETGNRTSKTDSTNGNETYTVNAANMLLSRTAGGTTSSYTNDANGNTLTGGGRTNTWDSQNRLVTCATGTTTSNFLYGADGLRRQTSVTSGSNTVTRKNVLDNGMMVRELATNTTTNTDVSAATYLQGASGAVYRRDDTGSTQTLVWYVYDGLGSVACEINPNGTVAARKKLDVYGLNRGSSGSASSKHGFVGNLGHTTDETGLVYMRARHYDPTTGRFQSEDPKGDGQNWLTYCNNDPVNYVDPNGQFTNSLAKISIAVMCVIASLTTAWAYYVLISKILKAAVEIVNFCKAGIAAQVDDLSRGIPRDPMLLRVITAIAQVLTATLVGAFLGALAAMWCIATYVCLMASFNDTDNVKGFEPEDAY